MSGSDEQRFPMRNTVLSFDPHRGIMVCRRSDQSSRKLWAKKIFDITSINGIIEDADGYYIAAESGEKSGRLLALIKQTGTTAWFIPGRSVLQVLYGGFLFAIFIDDTGAFYLVKVDRERGEVLWHFRVRSDLSEYRFSGDRISLSYASGQSETVSITNGTKLS